MRNYTLHTLTVSILNLLIFLTASCGGIDDGNQQSGLAGASPPTHENYCFEGMRQIEENGQIINVKGDLTADYNSGTIGIPYSYQCVNGNQSLCMRKTKCKIEWHTCESFQQSLTDGSGQLVYRTWHCPMSSAEATWIKAKKTLAEK